MVAGGIQARSAEARENAITARTVEMLESQNMRVEFDETGRPISALVSYIDDDGQTTYVESSAAVRAVRQQVSSGRYSQRDIQTGLQSNDQRRFFASSDYANRSASAYFVTVEAIEVTDPVTGQVTYTESQAEVDAATRTARSDVLNTTLGYVNEGATHLANFNDAHPNLTGMAVVGAQAALGGGPVKAVLTNVVREVVGDRISDAASNAIQQGVSGLLQERAGVSVAQANLGGMGAAFGAELLLFGGAKSVIGFAKDIRGAIGGLFRRSPAEAVRPLRSMGAAVNRSMDFSDKQLAKKWKHAADFGVSGNPNRQNIQSYQSAIERHLENDSTLVIPGRYRGDDVTHFVNPDTGLNVMRGTNGQFVSGWRLNPDQLENVISRGRL